MTDAIYFSKTTCGFYIDNVSEANRPDDAIEITREVYDDIFEQQRVTGKKIIGDENGQPTLDLSGPTAQENEALAKHLLLETDWTTLQDVTDETNTPYLTNYMEFKEYRTQLRAIAFNPTEGDIEWPTKPTAIWS